MGLKAAKMPDGHFCYPSNLALVPGVGLLVRDVGHGLGRLQVFASVDDIAMASMSRDRMAWLVAVARGIVRCGTSSRPPTVTNIATKGDGAASAGPPT